MIAIVFPCIKMLDYQENQLRQADEHTHDGDGHLEENTPQNKKGDCQIANLVHINGYASIMGGSIDGILYAAKHPHKHLDHQDEEHEISLRSIEQMEVHHLSDVPDTNKSDATQEGDQ